MRIGGFQTAGRFTEDTWTHAVVGEHEALGRAAS